MSNLAGLCSASFRESQRPVSEQHKILNSDKTLQTGGFRATSGEGFGGALELPSGRVIADRFRVIEELGRGGMGVVYRVEQLSLGREMALKTIDGHDIKDATWRRFQQEAKASSLLNHPNLICVHDSGVIDGRHPYFVMDLVQGTTLAKLVEQNGPLSVEEALPIFIQVCFGLAYAHDLGIVHRDLKPSNIMLSKPPGGGALTVKIVDFGIAKLRYNEGADIQELTKTGEIFGSPLYMSPEQCLGVAVDHRSDIYAIGCCMFEALAGLPPFMGNTALATMMQHQSEKPPTLKEATLGKEFSPEIEAIIARLLEKEPDKRYQSLKMLARDLSLLQQGSSNQSLTFSPNNTPLPTDQGKKVSYWFTFYACLATFLITGFGVWFIKDYIDNAAFKQKLATALDSFEKKEVVFDNFGSHDTVQSSILDDGHGKKCRRIFFGRMIGTYNIVGSKEIKNASGIVNIPYENSIHLRLSDPDCVANPKLFNQFQPGDITELTLGGNVGIEDATLKSLPHLNQLNLLNLNGNEVTDASLPYINQLPLRTLYIDKTQFTIKGILSLKRLKNLERIGIGKYHGITPILNELNPNLLRTLNIDMCEISVDDIKKIATMKNLEELSLYRDSAVTDETLKLLLPLKKLKRLDIGRTGTTAATIETLKTFPDLENLLLVVNQWSPRDILRCSNELGIHCRTYMVEGQELTGASNEEIEKQTRNLGATN